MNHTYHFIKQKRQQHHATNKIKQHSMNHTQTITPPKQTTSIHKKAAHQKGRFLWFLVILHRDLRVAPVVSRPTDSPHEKVTAALRSGLVVEFLVNWNLKYNWKKTMGILTEGGLYEKSLWTCVVLGIFEWRNVPCCWKLVETKRTLG